VTAPPHALVRASAGTGKTHRLVEQFLALLLAGVEPERVLATTFTRKAAGEILDRVLGRLLAAVEDPRVLAKLRALAPRGELSRADCIDLLARLARSADRLQARTLDSFFVAVARLFALDLDLPADWTITETIEDDALRSEAIARMLGDLAPEERLPLMQALHREAASRPVHAALLRIVREGLESFQESTHEAWRGVQGGHRLTDDELRALCEQLDAIQAPLTQKGEPHKPWHQNLSSARSTARATEWAAFVEIGLVKKVLAGEETFSRVTIDEATRTVLGAIASHAGAILLARIAQQTASTHSMLQRFDAAYRELKRERGLYRFEDLPFALLGSTEASEQPLGGRASDLWFRLDGRLDHLLFDEFQDTAPIQWRTLEPLAIEVLADGTQSRSFFCVGDVKQSIYGWRKADPRILDALGSRYPVLGSGESLLQSWRSSSVVLDTVKRVFERIGDLELFAAPENAAWRTGAERWQARFAPSSAAKELPGDAVLIQAHRDGDESAGEAAIRTAVERVKALVARAPRATIGVLVRRNAPIARMIFELKKHGILASGEGGNPLTDSDPVQVFLSALHLADHPEDSAAAFHVESSPLAAALGFGAGRARLEIARGLRARLVREGVGSVAESLLPAVSAASEWSEWDRRRFRQLVDLAHAEGDRAGLRPEAFARIVRETGVEDPSASRVRVMTVHKSKGLEFDVVVLPELGDHLLRKDSLFVSARTDPYGPLERVSRRPPAALLPFAPELAALVAAAETRDVEEALCVLYVALTRARRRIEMIAPPPPASGKPSEAKSYANLLGEALGAGEPDASGILWRHPEGRDDWDAELDEGKKEAPRREARPLQLRPTASPRALAARSASAAEGGAPNAARLLQAPSAPATTRGKLVHRWLEECTWLEGFAHTDADLLALGAELEPDEAARRSALALLREALDCPAIRALLTRPSSGTWHVETERAFSLVLPDDHGREHLWSGAIDRLVIQHDADRAVGAEIIDYKTDDLPPSELPTRIAFYRPQLEAYRRIAAAILGIPLAGIRGRLVFLSSGEVCEP
jgi:ATP-dependent exoDNAse (exonuclease V) beta subunit